MKPALPWPEQFSRHQTQLLAFLLFAVVLLTFWPVVRADFVQFDDDINVYRNPHIQELNLKNLQWMFTDVSYTPRYRPLNWLTWALLYHFFGASGPAFHAFGLLLHAANAVLVFLLARQFLRRWLTAVSVSGKNICAALGALFWAVHPLRVEAVGWVNCEMFLQSFFFLALSLMQYLNATQTGGKLNWKNASYRLSVLFFALSMLTYPTALGVVPVLLVLDWLLGRFPGSPRQWWGRPAWPIYGEKIPFALLAIMGGAFTLWARTHVQGSWTPTLHHDWFSWMLRLSQAAYVWCYYLWKPFWPADLSPVYTQLVSFDPLSAPFLGSLLLVVGATVGLVCLARRWPWLLALWLWHLCVLVPVLGLTDHPHYPSDRYCYLESAAWAVVGAGLLGRLWKNEKRRTIALLGSTVLALLLSVASFQQTRIWRNTETLFRHVIAKLGDDPYRADIYWRLGCFYLKKHAYDQAIQNLSTASQLAPQSAAPYFNLGQAFARKNELSDAEKNFGESLRINPRQPSAHYELALVLEKQNRDEVAVRHFAQAAEWLPQNADAHFRLALSLKKLGRVKEAFPYFVQAVQLNPYSPEARFHAAEALWASGKRAAALDQYFSALELKSAYADARRRYGLALAEMGRTGEAVRQLTQALQLQPDALDAILALGWIRAAHVEATFRQAAEAESLARRAVALTQEKDAAAWDLLAAVYAEAGKFPEALSTVEKALALTEAAKTNKPNETLRSRRLLYEKNQSYRLPPASVHSDE